MRRRVYIGKVAVVAEVLAGVDDLHEQYAALRPYRQCPALFYTPAERMADMLRSMVVCRQAEDRWVGTTYKAAQPAHHCAPGAVQEAAGGQVRVLRIRSAAGAQPHEVAARCRVDMTECPAGTALGKAAAFQAEQRRLHRKTHQTMGWKRSVWCACVSDNHCI